MNPKDECARFEAIMDRRILEGKKVLRFLSTPYGLIAIGQGTVGLIEPGP